MEKTIKELEKYECKIHLYDPWANRKEIHETYNIYPVTELKKNYYDGIIIAVAHDIFKSLGIKIIKNLCKKKSVIYDLKYLFFKKRC